MYYNIMKDRWCHWCGVNTRGEGQQTSVTVWLIRPRSPRPFLIWSPLQTTVTLPFFPSLPSSCPPPPPLPSSLRVCLHAGVLPVSRPHVVSWFTASVSLRRFPCGAEKRAGERKGVGNLILKRDHLPSTTSMRLRSDTEKIQMSWQTQVTEHWFLSTRHYKA